MKAIKLTRGQCALVDDSDYEYLNQFKWCAGKAYNRDTYYAIRSKSINGKQTHIRMHRLIMNAPNGMDVDHVDGDGLNNQRSNLRICTRSQNLRNQKSRVNSSSKYLGVCWHKRERKWRAGIRINKNTKYLGEFKTELEAAIIYNIAARKYYGEFARPNKFN